MSRAADVARDLERGLRVMEEYWELMQQAKDVDMRERYLCRAFGAAKCTMQAAQLALSSPDSETRLTLREGGTRR